MTRILHVLSQKIDRTGSGIFLRHLEKEAAQKGYDQAVISAVSMDERHLSCGFLKTIHYPVIFETEQLPIPVVGMSDVMPYKTMKYSELSGEKLEAWKNAFKEILIEVVAEFKPDVILTHHLWILTAMVRDLVKDIPVYGICHGTDIRQMELAPKFAAEAVAGCKLLDHVFALSAYQKEKIQEVYGIDADRITVVGGGFDDTVFYSKRHKAMHQSIRLVYAGKLSEAKGVYSLMRAVQKLAPVQTDMELLMVGGGSDEDVAAVKELAGEVQFPVLFTGVLPQEELAEVFRQSDIFVLPSFYEGLSLVVVEALASGLHVVTTELPGLREWLGDEINASGIIEYVSMPKLALVDKPIEEELPAFEDRLARSIETQMKRIIAAEGDQDPRVAKCIRQRTWRSVFERIEESYKNWSSY